MAKYTTRVELNDADGDDYDRLHTAMKQQGFSQTITSEDGTVYHLPTAEYSYSGAASRDDVLGRAKAAIAQINGKGMILVTESDGRRWWGLPRATRV